MLTVLQVGKPVPGLGPVTEGCRYDFREGIHDLILAFDRPSPDEVFGIKKAPISLRILGNDLMFFLLFRFGNAVPWCEARYEWKKTPAHMRVLPEPEELHMLRVLLIDTATQNLRVIRMLTPDMEFQRAINAAIRQQAERATEPTDGEVERYVRAMEQMPAAQLAAVAAGAQMDPASGAGISFTAVMKSFKKN